MGTAIKKPETFGYRPGLLFETGIVSYAENTLTPSSLASLPKWNLSQDKHMVFIKALPLSSLQAHPSQVGGGSVHPVLGELGTSLMLLAFSSTFLRASAP